MRILTAAVILATAAVSTAALAQTDRLTDSQFIAANHCRGLIRGADAAALDATIKANASGRVGVVLDRATVARKAAARKARKANGPGGKAELARELAGPCAAFAG
jgi:hypothetical protein